ncbi:hypothetical protein B0H14DRAFT_2617453 [Mycena olivaceomarginata]|nr:hypothetical protein B0H14DRAFT_2617453 [Mycena olivaceomarginata]
MSVRPLSRHDAFPVTFSFPALFSFLMRSSSDDGDLSHLVFFGVHNYPLYIRLSGRRLSLAPFEGQSDAGQQHGSQLLSYYLLPPPQKPPNNPVQPLPTSLFTAGGGDDLKDGGVPLKPLTPFAAPSNTLWWRLQHIRSWDSARTSHWPSRPETPPLTLFRRFKPAALLNNARPATTILYRVQYAGNAGLLGSFGC